MWLNDHNSINLKNCELIDKYGFYIPNHQDLSISDINKIWYDRAELQVFQKSEDEVIQDHYASANRAKMTFLSMPHTKLYLSQNDFNRIGLWFPVFPNTVTT